MCSCINARRMMMSWSVMKKRRIGSWKRKEISQNPANSGTLTEEWRKKRRWHFNIIQLLFIYGHRLIYLFSFNSFNLSAVVTTFMVIYLFILHFYFIFYIYFTSCGHCFHGYLFIYLFAFLFNLFVLSAFTTFVVIYLYCIFI